MRVATVLGVLLALCLSGIAAAGQPAPGQGTRFISGGGHIWEESPGGPPTASVSFAGHVVWAGEGQMPADYTCRWTVQFHDIAGATYDGSVFRSTVCRDVVVWAAGDPNGPEAAMSIIARGSLDKTPGYSLRLNIVDRGEPGVQDQIRLRLYAPGTDPSASPDDSLYDSSDEFSGDVGTQLRTYVDAGNFQSWVDAPVP